MIELVEQDQQAVNQRPGAETPGELRAAARLRRTASTRAPCRTGAAARGRRDIAPKRRASWLRAATTPEVCAPPCARVMPGENVAARWRAKPKRFGDLGRGPVSRAGRAGDRRERVADLLRRGQGESIRQRSRYLSLSGTFSHWVASSGPGFLDDHGPFFREFSIELGKLLLVFRQVVLGVNRIDRTLGDTQSAINAFIRVDHQNIWSLVKAVHGGRLPRNRYTCI